MAELPLSQALNSTVFGDAREKVYCNTLDTLKPRPIWFQNEGL